MLFKTIGYAAFAAVATMIILLPIQSTVARFFMKYQSQVLLAADKRLSLTTEVFQAIKVLKFFAWERKFQEKLDERRNAELVALQKRVVVFACGGVSMCKSRTPQPGLEGAQVVGSWRTFNHLAGHLPAAHESLQAATGSDNCFYGACVV